ncbi:MAG: hypothetical protein K8U57_21045 [Planctomycetes bacterium]|nr:hypothetical protein [Planctomycetota bacterium]
MTLVGTIRINLARLFRPSAAGGKSTRSITVRSQRLPSRRKGRATVFSFVAALLAIHALMFVVSADARVRDPEYGRRAASLRERIAENPGRPVTVVLGSSRVAMGIRPTAWEDVRPADATHPDPLIFNMGLIGSGPVMELMTLRRLYADGFRPDVVLLEFWPPFLHQEGVWTETNRIATDRLIERDRQIVREYFPDPERVERDMDWRRRNPIFANRERLLVQILSRWLLPEKRTDWLWDDLDTWGWKPGNDMEHGLSSMRSDAHARCAEIYKPLFATHKISPIAEQACRESVALARQHGATVGFVFLPESSEFRQLYSPELNQVVRAYLDRLCSELDIPVIDSREWVDDGFIVDGFHLSRVGAAEYTRKLGPSVAATFPKARERGKP